MKTIEDRLQQSKHPQPRRPLRQDFTTRLVAKLNDKSPKPKTRPKWMEYLQARLHKPAFAAAGIAGILVTGGAATAIVAWPTPSVTQTNTQQLPSGNHIVGYDLKDCDYFDTLNGHTPSGTTDKIYYEVRQGAHLTNEQLRNALQGRCEDRINNSAITNIIGQLPGGGVHGDLSTETLTVNAITKDSITVSPDSHYTSTSYQVKPNLTYTQFSKDLLVYDRLQKASYDDIHAGDSVIMVMRQANPKPVFPNNFTAENDPSSLTILAIAKVSPLTTDPTTLFDLWGSDIVRLNPCSTSPTGFCRAYDFVPQPSDSSQAHPKSEKP